jgi:hypothetical protein
MLPVAAVAGVAVPAGPVLRQVSEHRFAVRRLALPQPALFPHPDQVEERERRLRREPVLQAGLAASYVQMPAEAATVVDQPRPRARVVQQVVDEPSDTFRRARLPDRAKPRPQRLHRRDIGSGRGRMGGDPLFYAGGDPLLNVGGDLVLVQEYLERVHVRQVRRVHQVRRKHQGGRGVMSEKHVDS